MRVRTDSGKKFTSMFAESLTELQVEIKVTFPSAVGSYSATSSADDNTITVQLAWMLKTSGWMRLTLHTVHNGILNMRHFLCMGHPKDPGSAE